MPDPTSLTVLLATGVIAIAAIVQAVVAFWHFRAEKRAKMRQLQFLGMDPAFKGVDNWYRIDVVNPGFLSAVATHLNVMTYDGSSRSMFQRFDFYVGTDERSPPGLSQSPEALKVSNNLTVSAGERGTLFVKLPVKSQNYLMRVNFTLRGPGMNDLVGKDYVLTPTGWQYNDGRRKEAPPDPLDEEHQRFKVEALPKKVRDDLRKRGMLKY